MEGSWWDPIPVALVGCLLPNNLLPNQDRLPLVFDSREEEPSEWLDAKLGKDDCELKCCCFGARLAGAGGNSGASGISGF